MRRVIFVLLAVVAAFGVAACGSGEDAAKQRNTYADEVNRAQNDFAQSFKSLSRRITSTSTPGRGRKTLQGSEDPVGAVVVRRRRLDTPSDLQPLHRRLIDEIAGHGRAIHRAKLAFAPG